MSVPQLKYRDHTSSLAHTFDSGFQTPDRDAQPEVDFRGASMQRCIVRLLIHVNVNISTM